MTGGDRAGYLQNSYAVDTILITSTCGELTSTSPKGWYAIKIISSGAQFESITAPGMKNSSAITSATTFEKDAVIACASITKVKRSTKDSHGMATLHARVLI